MPAANNDDEEEEQEQEQTDGNDITKHPEFSKLQAYRMEQQVLMQLRATYLSEALVKRGIPLPSIEDVATPEGAKPSEKVDWDCALSTRKDPKMCIITFDPPPNTKVVVPVGSKDWVSLRALNRMRRDDPSKVEPMWHRKYAILRSWFDADSEYSFLQHVSFPGFLLNELLFGYRLHMAVAIALFTSAIVFMPILEYFANRFLVSGFLWMRWVSWHRFVHAALPLKLFLAQLAFSFLSRRFLDLVSIVKEILVEWECDILERSIPLTLGVPDMIPPGKEAEFDQDIAEWDLPQGIEEDDVDSEEDEEED